MIVAIAVAFVVQAASHVPPTSADFEKARSALDRQMLDLPSARFRDVHARAGVVCGFVNGKNRLGAYAGWQPFAAVTFDDAPEAFIGPDNAVMIETFCTGDPAPPQSVDYSDQMATR